MRKPVSVPRLKKKAQILFNEFIRLRDKDKPCISCNQFKQLQAGHYYPTQGYDGLRFDEFNTNGECAGCNCFDEGHLIGYGENLLNRIGRAEFDKLKQRAADYKRNNHKWSRSELHDLIDKYSAEIKSLT